MKRLTQIVKVAVLTFCLIIFSFNFQQVLSATECDEEAAHNCEAQVELDCSDQCVAESKGYCDWTEFMYGSCEGDECNQWYDIYCTGGYIGTYGPYICNGNGCPIFK